MTLLVDHTHCEDNASKPARSSMSTAMLLVAILLASVVLGLGFSQISSDMHPTISMMVVNGSKPQAPKTINNINLDTTRPDIPTTSGDGGGDEDEPSGDGGGKVNQKPIRAPRPGI